ncbi:MAG: gliding motility-associated C-terminal domain-containing protein [Chitinophagaceae bacterium]|nr:MAG: gliding motility-associated C-terminal domain-containing protein [Chitinophagaceae bacterium]
MKKTITTLLLICCCRALSFGQCTVPPDLFPTDSIMVCTGSAYTLNAPVVGGATYAWSVAGEAGTSVNLNASRRIWLTVDDGVCSITDTVTVLFNSFLLSPIVSNAKLCKGQGVTDLPVEGENLQWYDDAIGGMPGTGLPPVSTIDTGRVTYWFTQTILGCESPRAPMLVRVIDKPVFDLGDAFIIPCGTAGVTIQVVDDHESDYLWSTGATGISIIAPERGVFSLYAENMCGSHSDTTRAVECEDYCVQFPSAFSPNHDGVNDTYKAACFCPVPSFRLVVYNRNGEVVFKTTDPSAGWDGYFMGKAQPSGIYVFNAEFYDFVLKNTFTKKGTLMLVR